MDFTKLIVEFLGTFFFLAIILSQGKPIPIVVGLLASIYFGGDISGGHFNPAVTTMLVTLKKISVSDAVPYVIAQVAGGVAAGQWSKKTKKD